MAPHLSVNMVSCEACSSSLSSPSSCKEHSPMASSSTPSAIGCVRRPSNFSTVVDDQHTGGQAKRHVPWCAWRVRVGGPGAANGRSRVQWSSRTRRTLAARASRRRANIAFCMARAGERDAHPSSSTISVCAMCKTSGTARNRHRRHGCTIGSRSKSKEAASGVNAAARKSAAWCANTIGRHFRRQLEVALGACRSHLAFAEHHGLSLLTTAMAPGNSSATQSCGEGKSKTDTAWRRPAPAMRHSRETLCGRHELGATDPHDGMNYNPPRDPHLCAGPKLDGQPRQCVEPLPTPPRKAYG